MRRLSGIRQPHDADPRSDVRDLVHEHTRQLAWAQAAQQKPSVRAIDASCFDPVAKALTTALGT